MLEEFGVLYGRLIHEVKHWVLKGVVSYVQKRTYELDVPNPWECCVKTYKYVYQGFCAELQRVLFFKEWNIRVL